jgi:hypothetical protein
MAVAEEGVDGRQIAAGFEQVGREGMTLMPGPA